MQRATRKASPGLETCLVLDQEVKVDLQRSHDGGRGGFLSSHLPPASGPLTTDTWLTQEEAEGPRSPGKSPRTKKLAGSGTWLTPTTVLELPAISPAALEG